MAWKFLRRADLIWVDLLPLDFSALKKKKQYYVAWSSVASVTDVWPQTYGVGYERQTYGVGYEPQT